MKKIEVKEGIQTYSYRNPDYKACKLNHFINFVDHLYRHTR